jgi:ABC-2 type transport system ATP-binding protein
LTDAAGRPALSLERLTKIFAGRPAVDDLTLSIPGGEVYGLIGPNGSGKTTTVKLATGLYRPSAGRVLVDGVDLHAEPERAKRLLGYMPDEPFVYERMSGREFLHLVGELWGVARESRRARIAELAERFAIESILEAHVDGYSRGNRQKISIIAALLHAPRVLVVDEPIVGLDPESALRARDMLRAFAADGGAVLVCTHTLTFAEAVCGRVGLLREGRLVVEGDLASLRARARRENPDAGDSLEDLYLHFAARR